MGVKTVGLKDLGLKALLQLQLQNVDVSKELRGYGRADLITFTESPKTAVPSSNEASVGKYHVSAKDMRTADGIVFDSKLERSAYVLLKERDIDFDLHPRFELQAKFTDSAGRKFRAITYEADFLIRSDGHELVLDMKGFRTEKFIMKEKLFTMKFQRVIHCVKSVSELLIWLADNKILKCKTNKK